MTAAAGTEVPGRPRFAAAWLGALPFLGVIVFVAGLGLGVSGPDVPILALAATTGVFCLLPPILDQARPGPRRHLLLTFFSLFWFMYYVLPVWTRYFMGDPTNEKTSFLMGLVFMDPADIIRGQLAALVSLLIVYTAYLLPFGTTIGRALPQPRQDWSHEGTLLVAWGIIPVGWAIYLGSQLGIVPGRAGSGALGVVAMGIFYGIALLAFAYIRYRSRTAFLAMTVLIPLTMAFNFFTGSKTKTLLALAMVAFAYVVVNRRIRIRYVAAAVLGIALLYPTAAFYRDVVLVENTKTAVDILRNPVRAIDDVSAFIATHSVKEYLVNGFKATGNRTSALNMTTLIIRDTPDRVPFQGGWTIGYAFVAYIPRIIWPGKPAIGIGQWVTDNYVTTGPGIIRSSTGPSWIGELYLNFGYWGIIVGMFIVGTYFRVLHEWVFHPKQTIPMLLLGVVCLFSICPTLGGTILGCISFLPFFGPAILLGHWVARSVGPPVPVAGSGPTGLPANAGVRT